MTTISYQEYLEDPYLEEPYLTELAQASTGMQCRAVINSDRATGMQTRSMIQDFPRATGMQARQSIVDFISSYGMQTRGVISDDSAVGMQARGFILDRLDAEAMQSRRFIAGSDATGMQARRTIVDFLDATGMQALQVRVLALGMQCFAQLYNTTNLRILNVFQSRGVTGNNWTASNTAVGDFDANNVNTDIVEQYWRTGAGFTTAIALQCDTQLPQGVFIDTMSVQGHNLTSSATVFMQGADVSDFSTVGESIPIQITPENLYYIAPDPPTTGYKYIRFLIDDPTNPDGFIRFGTVLFGHADIFQGECYVDEIGFRFKDFADSVATEGFTNVSNSRALKKVLDLEFRSLRYHLANFRILRAISTTFRTTHKCLWIPTPDKDDMTITSRFAVYGKLAEIPSETHNWKGSNADYVSMKVEVDESK